MMLDEAILKASSALHWSRGTVGALSHFVKPTKKPDELATQIAEMTLSMNSLQRGITLQNSTKAPHLLTRTLMQSQKPSRKS